ncbi:hypothetical protein [Photorhabdus stackebrandtii]|uniref:hypothetical protein n=1 Tax=Photorhabdus stackebrandtii TaxID=1123042 RepID=UPI001A99544D|nr:hypothetical protein [Photorhabdus stackebrandtii]
MVFDYHKDIFRVDISAHDKNFTLAANYGYQTSKSGSTYEIKEWIEFVFSPSEDQQFDVSDVSGKPIDLLHFFSVIIGVPINMVSVDIGEKKDIQLYFPFAKSKLEFCRKHQMIQQH